MQLELRCCWDCRPCRDYEIVVDNNTKCQECKKLFWPDENTFMECVEISPTYLRWDEALPLVCLILSLLGLSACVCVTCFVLKTLGSQIDQGNIKGTQPDGFDGDCSSIHNCYISS